jgi:hypothetical protein
MLDSPVCVGPRAHLVVGYWSLEGSARRGLCAMPESHSGNVDNTREASLAALQEKLADSVQALVTGSDWTRAMVFAARFRSRSFGNTLLIYAQHLAAFELGRVPESFPTYVAGFHQWKQLDRAVAKGQTGYMIQAPVTARFASATPSEAGSWRTLGRAERPRAGEVVQSRMIGVKPAYVWDVSQTTGEPIPERPRPQLLTGQAPAGLWDGLAALVGSAGFAVTTVPDAGMIGGANGVTNFGTRVVAVRADMDDAAMVKTLAHELAHVLMHAPDDAGRSSHRGIGEVEAESVALMVAASFGMTTDGYSVPYVASWSSSVAGMEPAAVVRSTGERVRRTALGILDQLPEPSPGDGTPPGLERTMATGVKSAVRVDRLPAVGAEVRDFRSPRAGAAVEISVGM